MLLRQNTAADSKCVPRGIAVPAAHLLFTVQGFVISPTELSCLRIIDISLSTLTNVLCLLGNAAELSASISHSFEAGIVNPLTAGAAYMRVFIFISTLSTTF